MDKTFMAAIVKTLIESARISPDLAQNIATSLLESKKHRMTIGEALKWAEKADKVSDD